MGSNKQTFGELVVHTPHTTVRLDLPWTFSTFDYPELCRLLFEQSDCEFETAKVDDRSGNVVHTDRGDLSAPLIVDALGWRRVLGSGYQPPDAPSRAGSRCTPGAAAPRWRSGSTAPTCPPATAGASPRTTSCGSASARSTPLPRQGQHGQARGRPGRGAGPLPGQLDSPQAAPRDRGQRLLRRRLGRSLPAAHRGGNPHRALLRPGMRSRAEERRGGPAPQGGRPAPLPRLQRRPRVDVPLDAARAQHLVPRVPPRLLARGLRGMEWKRFVDWSFGHYLEIAHPRMVAQGPPPARRRAPERAAA